jgi:membrane protein YdbS with pleckstrin-like domain
LITIALPYSETLILFVSAAVAYCLVVLRPTRWWAIASAASLILVAAVMLFWAPRMQKTDLYWAFLLAGHGMMIGIGALFGAMTQVLHGCLRRRIPGLRIMGLLALVGSLVLVDMVFW